MLTRTPRRILMISTHGYVAVHPELGKPDTGGQVVYVLKLAECLGRMGYKVDIATRRFEDQPAIEPLNEQVRILRFPCGGNEFIGKEWLCDSIPEWVEHAARFLSARQLRYAFINSHYWDAGLAGVALAERLGLPHFHTPHSIGAWKRDNMDEPADVLERKYNFARRVRDEAAIYAASDLLLATTDEQRAVLQSPEYAVPDEKILTLPPGYDDLQFFPVSEPTRQTLKEDLDAAGPIILALGRMAHNKGYDLLIEAFTVVAEPNSDARLLLAVGSTSPSPRELEQIDELRKLASARGIADRVLFRDYIPDDLLAEYYRAADVFALSSRYEPFGMTAVEAMACGTPTVVTTHGGLWKMLNWGRDALYADPFDSGAYGHALATVLQFPEVAQRLASRGAETARAKFTWNGVAQQLLGCLDQVLRDARSIAAANPRPAAVVQPGAADTRRSTREIPASAAVSPESRHASAALPVR